MQVGYYPQLLRKYLQIGRITRVRRGIYRLAQFPPGDFEDLVVLWLWSRQAGVFSHETALLLHQLSDSLPAQTHMTLPASWRTTRHRLPLGLVTYFDDLRPDELSWAGPVRLTSPTRTVLDCAVAGVSPELIAQAVTQGLHRGPFTSEAIKPALAYLDSFGLSI